MKQSQLVHLGQYVTSANGAIQAQEADGWEMIGVLHFASGFVGAFQRDSDVVIIDHEGAVEAEIVEPPAPKKRGRKPKTTQ